MWQQLYPMYLKNAWQLICDKITPLTMASYVWIVWCQYYYGTVLPTHGMYRILLCTLTHEQIWAYAAISTQWQMQLPGLVFYFFLLFLSSLSHVLLAQERPNTRVIFYALLVSSFLQYTLRYLYFLFNCFEKLDKMPTMHPFLHRYI